MLKLKNIYKSFNGQNVLKNISLNIYENQIFGIIGANGSGKSTLLNIISNSIEADKGDILDEKHLRNSTLYINETPNIFPELSVLEQMKLIANINNRDLDEVTKLALDFNLEEVLLFKAKKLSTGFKQRLTFCLAILTNPKLLILDEPCNALDYIQRKNFYSYLLKLKTKTTIVISSHMLEFIETIADKLLILNLEENKYFDNPKTEIKSLVSEYETLSSL